MLVLSRRVNERIVLPGVDTTIQVVAVKPGVVRLGIEAPEAVAVFREEVCQRDGEKQPRGHLLRGQAEQLHELNHLVRNQANTAGIGIDLARRQLEAGQVDSACRTLATIEGEIRRLSEQVQTMVEPPRPTPRPAGRPMRALLAEDNQNERELFAGLLRLAGLDVETANDGEDVLQYLGREGRPDVLLLDMSLPRRDGPSTVRVIRNDPAYADLKIFAVSGHRPDYFGLDERSSGVDRWFLKPINPGRMLQEISASVSSRA